MYEILRALLIFSADFVLLPRTLKKHDFETIQLTIFSYSHISRNLVHMLFGPFIYIS